MHAQAVLATSYALNFRSRRTAYRDKAANSRSSEHFTVANAHVMLASICAVSSLSRRSSRYFTSANAHVKLASPRDVNSYSSN